MAGGKPFTKGTSGNPGGRPKIAALLARIKESPEKLRDEIFGKAIAIVRAGPKSTNDATFRHAFDFVAAHLGLKPKDVVVHEFGGGDTDGDEDFESMSMEELDRIIAEGTVPAPPPEDDGGDPAN